jgi:hypothetical protein
MLFEIAAPEASVVAAPIVVAPVVLPALTVIVTFPVTSVSAVPEAGLKERSEVVENLTTAPTMGKPAPSFTVAVSFAGLSIDTDVVALSSEDFVSDNTIEPAPYVVAHNWLVCADSLPAASVAETL